MAAQSRHSHSTVTAQSQHSHSTCTAHAQHRHSTVTAQSQTTLREGEANIQVEHSSEGVRDRHGHA
eukprot:8829023-Pyramimonas_sp.AAC.1